jgi:transglutaminase-like putative cysteine protease
MAFLLQSARRWPFLLVCVGVVAACTRAGAEPGKDGTSAPASRTRTFQFTYAATVTGLKADESARVWLPVPQSSDEQDVTVVSAPKGARLTKEKKYGNAIYSLETKADTDGKIPLEMVVLVKRREVKGEGKLSSEEAARLADFLKPDAKVPIDGKPLELIKDKKLPADQTDLARVLYEAVNAHMRYSKEGQGWGRGDSVWACENGYGNCTDFHSLFISLARAEKIPAKFEIGFPIPEKRGSGEVAGYHCWAKFRPQGKGWIAVDISEANKNPKMKDYYFGNLTEDRVTFTTGRDLELSPKQDGEPLNFFVYPYVEVGGKAYPQEKITRKFTYEDK